MLTDLTAHLPRLKMRKVQPRRPKALAEVEVGGGIGAGAGLLPGPPRAPPWPPSASSQHKEDPWPCQAGPAFFTHPGFYGQE